MARTPGLKPTTAIKAIGVTDPSAIRRLREKLREMKGETGETGTFTPKRQRAATLAVPASSLRAEPAAVAAAEPLAGTANKPEASEPAPLNAGAQELETWFTYWCGLTLEGVNASMKFQQLYAGSILTSPPMALALGQGVAATDALIALAKSQQATRK